jgi:transcriptional regulator with XRE-family HTH domain
MRRRVQKNSDYYKPIARLVMEARRKRRKVKLTQKELAEKIGTNQSVIARFETLGRLPTYDFLVRLCNALGSQLFLSVNGEYTVVVPDELRVVVDRVSKEMNEEKSVFLVNLMIDSLNKLNRITREVDSIQCGANGDIFSERQLGGERPAGSVGLSSLKKMMYDDFSSISATTSLCFPNSGVISLGGKNPGFQKRIGKAETRIEDNQLVSEFSYEEEEERIRA